VCFYGNIEQQIALDDVPSQRGPCDAPYCSEDGKPLFRSDGTKCAANQACSSGECVCSGCPNGTVIGLPATFCRFPSKSAASANKTLTGSSASRAIDGDYATILNSGTSDGTLTLQFPSTRVLTAVVIYVTGAYGGSGEKTVKIDMTLDQGSGGPISKSAVFDYTAMVTAPIRVDVGLVSATKLTFEMKSPSTWISVQEVLFVVCD